jgi:hypothetical protein
MENKESLTYALSDLKKKGYEADFTFELETASVYGRKAGGDKITSCKNRDR